MSDSVKKDPEKVYPEDQYYEMKKAGMDKPPNISWTQWNAPRRLTHRHMVIAHMAAMGATNKQICEELNISPSRMSIILKSTRIQEKINELLSNSSEKSMKARLDRIVPQAIDVTEKILNDETEASKLRSDIAFKFMERAWGKPAQKVDVQDTTLEKLFDRLDRIERQKEIEVSQVKRSELEHIEDAEVVVKKAVVEPELETEEDLFNFVTKWGEDNLDGQTE